MKIGKILGLALLAIILCFFLFGIAFPDYEYSCSVTVSASPAKCWDVFHDVSKMGQWTEGFESMRKIQGDSMAPGATYELVVTDGERMVMQEKIIESVKPSRAAFELTNDVLRSEFSFNFIDQQGKTQISSHYKVTGNNIIWKSIFVFFRPYFRSQSQHQLESLKKVIESTSRK